MGKMTSSEIIIDPVIILIIIMGIMVCIYGTYVFMCDKKKAPSQKEEKEQLSVVSAPQKETYGLTGTDYEHMRTIELVENQAYFTRLAFTYVEAGNCREAKVFLDAALALSSKAKETLDDEAQHKKS
jgi:flagellar basal body-associated protein FliL